MNKGRGLRDDYHRKLSESLIMEISGEDMSDHVADAIKNLELIGDKKPIDYYNLAQLYICNAKDNAHGYLNIKRAIEEIKKNNKEKKGSESDNSDNFDEIILMRLGDLVKRNDLHARYKLNGAQTYITPCPSDANVENINIVKINQIIADDIKQAGAIVHTKTKNNIKSCSRKQTNKSANKSTKKPRTPRKNPSMLKKWLSNNQNVHDSSMHDDINTQYKYIKESDRINNASGGKEKGGSYKFRDIWDWMIKSEPDPTKRGHINAVMIMVERNNKVPSLEYSSGEKELLITLWKRAHHPINKKRTADIKNALRNAIINCHERGIVVCLTGRSTRMMGALAYTDAESESTGLGILKSKEITRNEIFEKASDIVNRFLKQLPVNIYDKYINDVGDADVQALEKNIKNEIDNLRGVYAGKLPKEILNNTIQEAKEAV